MGETRLRGVHLRKAFGAFVAINDVSLAVNAGEVVALLGPNGAGKSTLLSLLAGLLMPDDGTAEIYGESASAAHGAARRFLGFVAGDTQLYGRLTARETLVFFGRLHGIAEGALPEHLDQIVDELGLAAFLDKRCDAMSAGQKQRVNIARALVHRPPVLILDEPTTALDVASQRFVLDVIERARARGAAVLFSSHVMGEVDQLADRVALIERGALRAQGTLDEIRARAGRGGLASLFEPDMELGTRSTP